MKNGIFIANFELNENEGIYKKVYSQATGIANRLGKCYLLTKKDKNTKVDEISTYKKMTSVNENNIYDTARKIICTIKVDIVYIRLLIPNPRFISFLRFCKKNSVKLIYEIPTYPYYGEQLKTARKKYRAIGKIIIDFIFWPFVYYYVDNVAIILSNTNKHIFKKMIEISNGANISSIKVKNDYTNNKNVFSIVTVGTLYPYHGYDRVLRGLKKCNETVDGVPVIFSIIGSSPTIEDLKKLSDKLELKNVKFLGIKSTDQLNELFDSYDLGLGCLALHRRNANVDTTIKIIEYYCRGLPALTSGISPMDQYDKNATIHVSDSENSLDFEEIYKLYKEGKVTTSQKISKIARAHFSWEYIMKELIDRVCLDGE